MAARAVSARNSNRGSRPNLPPVSNEPVKAVEQVEAKTCYLVNVHPVRFTWTVITDDPEEAIHLVKQQLCIRGYEKRFKFTAVKATLIETNGIFQGIPIVEAKTEEPPPVHHN